jgi:hypothetical protein
MNTFQWLLVLGFPANVAAAKTMPELFTAEEIASAEADELIRLQRLHADRAGLGEQRFAGALR